MFLQNIVSIPKIDGFTYWKTSGLYGSIRKIAPCKSMKVTQIIIKFPDFTQSHVKSTSSHQILESIWHHLSFIFRAFSCQVFTYRSVILKFLCFFSVPPQVKANALHKIRPQSVPALLWMKIQNFYSYITYIVLNLFRMYIYKIFWTLQGHIYEGESNENLKYFF